MSDNFNKVSSVKMSVKVFVFYILNRIVKKEAFLIPLCKYEFTIKLLHPYTNSLAEDLVELKFITSPWTSMWCRDE